MRNYKDLDKRYRYSLRKFKVGVASVAVGAFFLISGNAALASDKVIETEKETTASAEKVDTESTVSTVTETTPVEVAAVNKVENREVALKYTVKFVDEKGNEIHSVEKTKSVETSEKVAKTFVTENGTDEFKSEKELVGFKLDDKTEVIPVAIEEGKENVVTVKVKRKTQGYAANNTQPVDPKNNATERPDNHGKELTAGVRFKADGDASAAPAAAPEGAPADTPAKPTTTTPMNNGTGHPGEWKEKETVTNKDEITKKATIEKIIPKIPDGYVGDPTPGRTTFMIQLLSSEKDKGVTPKDDFNVGGSFNLRTGRELYFVLSANTESDEKKVYVNLYDKKTGKIALNDEGTAPIQDEIVVLADGNKVEFTGINKYGKTKPLVGQRFNYSLTIIDDTLPDEDGNEIVLRNLQLRSGMSGNALNTLVYHTLTPIGGVYNAYSGLAPSYKATQTTYYYVKATERRSEDILAKYSQTGNIAGGNTFTISGEAKFDNYELVDRPEVTEGTLISPYVVGTKLVRWYDGKLYRTQSKVQIVTKKDGTSRFLNFLVNPDHPDFLKNHAKYYNMTEDYFAKNELDSSLRLNERLAIVDKTLSAIEAVKKEKLSNDEETAKINEIREKALKELNNKDTDIFFLAFVSEEVEPSTYNTTPDAITGKTTWSYTSENHKFANGKGLTNIINFKLEEVNGYPNGNFVTAGGSPDMYRKPDGKTQLNDAEGNRIWTNAMRMTMLNPLSRSSSAQNYYYAEKGGVKVYFVNTKGETIQNEKVIISHAESGVDYDTSVAKDKRIEKEDKVYFYKNIDKAEGNKAALKEASKNTDTEKREIVKITDETGDIERDKLKELTYVYEEAGSVIVNYVNKYGTVIKAKNEVFKNVEAGTKYDTTTDAIKPQRILGTDGKTYELVPDKTGTLKKDNSGKFDVTDTAPTGTKGDVESGVTKEITYVYREVKGAVKINYITYENGQPVELQPSIVDTEAGSIGTQYNAAEKTDGSDGTEAKDEKPTIIKKGDETYRLVRTSDYKKDKASLSGTETGKVVEGTTEITYVYEKVTGDVILNYINDKGQIIKAPYTDTDDANLETGYNAEGTTPNDNKPEKPEKIEKTESIDGKVYYLDETKSATRNEDTTFTVAKDTPVNNKTGNVTEKTTYVNYVYVEAGSVVVNYVDTEGNVIRDQKSEKTDAKPGEEYNTTVDTTRLPEIKVGEKTYRLVEKSATKENGKFKVSNDPVTNAEGTVESGVTKEVTYVYEEVKGTVTINYVDDKGKVIKDSVVDTEPSSIGTKYNATENTNGKNEKPEKIVAEVMTETGEKVEKVYYLNPDKSAVRNEQDGNVTYTIENTPVANSEGKVTEAPTHVNYVYSEAGSVVVNYVDTDGKEIKTQKEEHKNVKPGTKYDTDVPDTKLPKIITEEGKVYRLVENKKADRKSTEAITPESPNPFAVSEGTVENKAGQVESGVTKEVTYVYEEVKGSVTVKYENEAGEKIKEPAEVVTDQSVGSEYSSVEKRPEKIEVPNEADPENPTVYYLKRKEIPGEDPTTKQSVPDLKENSAPEKGKVKEEAQTVTYVYEKAGSVVVNYVDENGKSIAPQEKDTTNERAGTPYDTTDKKLATIEVPQEDGTKKVYELVPTKKATPKEGGGFTVSEGEVKNEKGAVVKGETTEVTYVYKEKPKGKVIVNYVDENGNPIVGKKPEDETKTYESGLVDTPESYVGTKYNTSDDNKPTTITTKEGKIYDLVPSKTATPKPDGNGFTVEEKSPVESGEVTEGTTNVTYVYKERPKGKVIVNYVDENGNPIEGTNGNVEYKSGKEDKSESYVGTEYNTSDDNKPTTITTNDGVTYELVPKLTKGKESGEVTEGTTEVTYVYKKVTGDVVVNYVNTKGEEIKDPFVEKNDANIGESYNTTDNKPSKITTEEGKVYYRDDTKSAERQANDGNVTYTVNNNPVPENQEKGAVVAGETHVNYVYVEAGSVVVNYVDTEGNVIKAQKPEKTNVKPGEDYNTTGDETKLPEIKVGDKLYRLVANKNAQRKPSNEVTEGQPEFTVSEGPVENGEGSVLSGVTTEVTYVYEEVKGSVEVTYENEEGEKIAEKVEDTPKSSLGKHYETYERKPETITVKGTDNNPDTVYYLKEHKATSAPEEGEVKEGVTTVTYVYEKAGSVIVNYVDETGAPIVGTGNDNKKYESGLKDTDNKKAGTSYNTSDHKPTTITTDDGRIYDLVPANNGVKPETSPEEGTVVKGETTVVTYVYKERPKETGDVIVNYIDEATGKPIALPYHDKDDAPVGKEYNTGENVTPDEATEDNPARTEKPAKIVVPQEDGTTKVYELVPEKHATTTDGKTFKVVDGAPVEEGEVTKETTYVTYVYKEVKEEKKGTVTISYINEDGKEIKSSITEDPAPVGEQYNAEENTDGKNEKPEKITKVEEDGTTTVYYLNEGKSATRNPDGSFTVDTDTPINNKTGEVTENPTYVNYVYEKAGSVVVNYVDENGNKLNEDPTKVKDNEKPGTGYNTDVPDVKLPEIKVGDKVYVLVPDKQATPKEGEEGKFVVTDGKVPNETGTVVSGETTQVTYVYKEKAKGSVIVNYVDEKGQPIVGVDKENNDKPYKSGLEDTKDGYVGKDYDTTDNKPTRITTADGTVYYFKEVQAGSADEKGTVTEETKTVTYVYEKAGSVIVNYVDENGNELIDPVKKDEKPGTDYDTTKPEVKLPEIPVGDKEYVLVPNQKYPNEKGTIVSGETTEVTYVYKEKAKGSVIVNYVDENGNLISGTGNDNKPYESGLKDTENAYVGKDYDTTDHKPKTIEVTLPDGTKKLYELVAVQEGSADEIGKVQEGTITVTYVYKEVTPVEPGKPVDPEKPTPGKPGTPVPPTPGKPGVELPETPENPTPQTPEQPGKPTPQKPEVPGTVTPEKPTTPGKVVPGKQVEKLPNTGDAATNSTLAGLGLLGLVALVARRRKNK